jgi:hypothetical protein
VTGEEATALVIDVLNAAGVPHMLVGSLATNLYGIPRSTQDADLVLELRSIPIAALVNRLPPDFRLDPQMSFETVTGTTRYLLELPRIRFKVELFLLSDDPHDQERFNRRVRARFHERDTFVLTAEDVIISKLRWALHARRAKDEDDVRNVIAVQGPRLDWEYIHRWCERHGTRALLDRIRASLPPSV